MANKNPDHFKVGGRGGGPVGPRSQHKRQFAQERAVLHRDQERILPGERPLTGREGRHGAVEEAEAQLASVHGEALHRPSVLDSLPKPKGTVGVPRSARPVVGVMTTEREEEEGVDASEQGTWNLEPRESEAPYGFGIPASEDAALGHAREPFAREAGEMHHAAREPRPHIPHLPRIALRAIKTFPSLVRVVGNAARAVDRPIRRTLDTLQHLGHEVRKPS